MCREEVYETPARVEDSLYILQILDTAGTDECGIIREDFYHQCDGYLLVFSVIDRFSLQEIKEIQKDIKRYVNLSIPFLVVGNKIDLSESRRISSNEGETIASMLWGEYIETSAWFHFNVDRVFHNTVSMRIHSDLNHLPPLSECKRLQKTQFKELHQILRDTGNCIDEDVKNLSRIFSDALLPGQMKSKIDYLRDCSTCLSGIELSFKAE
ncbi:Ras-related protein R-Ras2 [Oopsacas minuta]|uniref:Ras-related protein R-Ras2 n=1 Tax=Oopsacas minuta TaxID=111878 RepID=A0AAV7JTK6_9METZ|nr:Ras-related protein R-Ras2 [Oopsacas minuta]